MTRIAVLATHGLGAECLRSMAAHGDIDVPLVVTYPPEDEHWWEDSVYDTAEELGLSVVPISRQDEVLSIDVDYILSVYYPEILDAELLDHPSEGALNLHQAELPRYRGSNVFAHAIMNARHDDHWRYGTTLHEMVEEVDAGPIVDRRFVDIHEDDTARTLYDRTREASVELFEEWIPYLADQTVLEHTTPQTEFDGERYFYTKESLDDKFEIDRERLAATSTEEQLAVYDQIRALEFPPLDPAYVELEGNRVFLTTSDQTGE